MKEVAELVVDEHQFITLRAQCESILDVKKRLPEIVFRKAFPQHCVIEHAYVVQKSFGAVLYELATQFGDETVCYMSVEPDPVEYYHRHYGFYGIAVFNRSSLPERYLSVMKRGGEVDSFYSRGGDIGVIWGSALKWAIFCDRISWEVAVLASSEEFKPAAKSRSVNCMNSKSLSMYIHNQYSADTTVATKFCEMLVANYKL